MDNIKIKATLKAYTRGLLPTKVSELENDLHFVVDVDKPGLYVRKQGEWVNVDDSLIRTQIFTPENSGLDLEQVGYDYNIKIKKYDIKQSELPSELEEDTTYYVLDQTANLYINGGTAFSSDNNNVYSFMSTFNDKLIGGKASSNNPQSEDAFTSYMKPLNSQGVYNG